MKKTFTISAIMNRIETDLRSEIKEYDGVSVTREVPYLYIKEGQKRRISLRMSPIYKRRGSRLITTENVSISILHISKPEHEELIEGIETFISTTVERVRKLGYVVWLETKCMYWDGQVSEDK